MFIRISKENLSKIFDRFYRSSEDRSIKGFGLGLSIAKTVVDNIKGQIKIESEIDKGTQAIIILPK